MRASLILGAALFAGVLAAPAAADTVRFDYDGNEFTEHVGLFPAQDRFTGFIVVDLDRLAGGTLVNAAIGPFATVDFFFSDGDRVFFPGNVGGTTIGIFTDASGDIETWSIRVGESVFQFTLASVGGWYPAGDESFINVSFGLRAWNTNPGTWTREPPPAPQVPEPHLLALLAVASGAAIRRVWARLAVTAGDRRCEGPT